MVVGTLLCMTILITLNLLEKEEVKPMRKA